MKRLPILLADYAAYHRDARNRLTHYVGVPLIIYAVLTALALMSVPLFGRRLGIEWLIVALFAVFYLSIDWVLGAGVSLALALLALAGELTTQQGETAALSVAIIGFVLGWSLQLLGHRLEGNRPALLDNLLQILIAPLFLAAELAFALGRRATLKGEVEQRLRT